MQDRTHRGFNGTPYSLEGHIHTNLGASGFSELVNPAGARSASTQGVSGNVSTKVRFGTIDYNPNNNWDAINNRYVAATSGIYSVLAALRFTNSIRCELMLYKNGSFYRTLQDYKTVGVNAPFSRGETDIPLNTNDYLEIWIITNTGCTIAADDAYVCIKRFY